MVLSRRHRPLIMAITLLALLFFSSAAFLPVPATRLFAPDTPGCNEAPLATSLRAWAVSWWWWVRSLDPASLFHFFSFLEQRADASNGDDDELHVEDPSRLHIFIDRERQRLSLYEGSRRVATYPVAVGKPSTPTPPGEWHVIYKGVNWGGGFGTRWLGINVPWGIYGIHGTNAPSSIGTRASAGCVRMHNRDVEELFAIVPVSTPVVISGTLPTVSGSSLMARGRSGKATLVLQVRLRQAGFDPGELDGRFGSHTEAAVREFQAFHGFEPTGELPRYQQRILGHPE